MTAAHCLDPQYGDYKEKTVIWGRTDLTTNDGTVAKIASYWIHPDPDASGGCKNIGWTFTPDKQLCFGPTKNDTLGVCSGDSGSPLVVSTAAYYRQVGLIESGDSQCQGPQVGAKITKYEALIRAQLGDGPPDPPTGGITNGGFESATAGWTAAGTTAAVTTGAHSGAAAARLGAATATNGESKLSQSFTKPAPGSPSSRSGTARAAPTPSPMPGRRRR